MERRLNVLIVEGSIAVDKTLLEQVIELNNIATISAASTAEKAFSLISKQTDVIVWGLEFNAEIASSLKIYKEKNCFSLMIVSKFIYEEFKNNDIEIPTGVVLIKPQEIKDLPRIIHQLSVTRSTISSFFNYPEHSTYKFTRDPLF
ncbi:hypothetical protein [Segetibacter koreensis]|uniref:hypothetical protein n=1 Tax=Segetibacter koreensis TaxID=398037 RepID=UPI0003805E7D|nr:hypothetical protein [Segetibacter koreensis]